MSKAEQVTYQVEGKTIAGLLFQQAEIKRDETPILALHGWLDNASSFETLAPLLTSRPVLAIDLPGHGLSDHRSSDAGYQIWDDLPQLIGLLDQLDWQECILLGHSRGAMISTLLTATMPDRVKALITLDGLVSLPNEDEKTTSQLSTFLKDRKRLSSKPARVFESKEDFIQRRARSGEPMNIAAQLADRNLIETENGFQWRGDHRLSGASALKLNDGQINSVLGSLKAPVLNIWATPSERMKRLSEAAQERAKALIGNLHTAHIDGHHHWHMERQAAEQIAVEINQFIENLSK